MAATSATSLSFQYQKGAIKTVGGRQMQRFRNNFNTKKVRLKHAAPAQDGCCPCRFQYQKGAIKTVARSVTHHFRISFQYQKGAIKTLPPATVEMACPNFNTKKVRLKPAQEKQATPWNATNFNTKKVRLKPHTRQGLHRFLWRQFQYQKGAIKTARPAASQHADQPFQYQKGAIKTVMLSGYPNPIYRISIPKRCD